MRRKGKIFPVNTGSYFKCFLAMTTQDKFSVQLQAGETCQFTWISPSQLADFLNQKLVIPRQKARLTQLFL